MSTVHFATKFVKDKQLQDGTHPIVLQTTFDSKKVRRFRIGLHARQEDWDFENDLFITKKYSAFRKYNRQLLDILDKAESLVNTHFATKEFDYNEFVKLFRQKEEDKISHTVFSFFDWMISQYDKVSTQSYYKDVKNSIRLFYGKDLQFSQITKEWLQRFEQFYKARPNCSDGGIRAYMRGIRSMMRRAIKEGHTKKYPFYCTENPNGYSFSHLKSSYIPVVLDNKKLETVKNKQELDDIRIALLSYYLAGANFADLIHLKNTDIQDKVLRYFRQKTGRLVVVPITPKAKALLQTFENNTEYLLDIYPTFLEETDDPKKLQEKIIYRRRRITKLLKRVTGDPKMRFYNMRHTSATNMVLNGVPLEYIQQLYSHSDLKTTQVYVGSLPVDRLRESVSVL